jgi:hypothetical protein
VAEQLAGTVERVGCPVAGELDRDPKSGRDADQRRAADRQAADCLRDLPGGAQLELDLLFREPCLVERPKRATLEAERLERPARPAEAGELLRG